MRLAHVLQIFWFFPFPRFRVFQLPKKMQTCHHQRDIIVLTSKPSRVMHLSMHVLTSQACGKVGELLPHMPLSLPNPHIHSLLNPHLCPQGAPPGAIPKGGAWGQDKIATIHNYHGYYFLSHEQTNISQEQQIPIAAANPEFNSACQPARGGTKAEFVNNIRNWGLLRLAHISVKLCKLCVVLPCIGRYTCKSFTSIMCAPRTDKKYDFTR